MNANRFLPIFYQTVIAGLFTIGFNAFSGEYRSIDLTAFYNAQLTDCWHYAAGTQNGANLSALPSGSVTLAGTPFQIGGIVQLYGSQLEPIRHYPTQVQGIKVESTFQKLYMLHATGWGFSDKTSIARLVWHYSDGSSRTIPILDGVDVADWWVSGLPLPTNAIEVWKGSHALSPIHLFMSTWTNDKPQVRVTSIDYVSLRTESAPFMLALTAYSEAVSTPTPTATAVKTNTPTSTPTPVPQSGIVYQENFDQVPEFQLPKGWVQVNSTEPVGDSFLAGQSDLANSSELAGWTVISRGHLEELGSNRLSVPELVSGNCLYAESDLRSGIQIQYIYTPIFDLRNYKNIRMSFDSNYTQNQDNLACGEYTLQGNLSDTDPRKEWRPIFYWVDSPEKSDAGENANSLFQDNGLDDDSSFPYFMYIGALTSQIDVNQMVEGRTNDDQTSSKKRESYSLPLAGGQGNVQIRFFYGGGASWYWGIDHFEISGDQTSVIPTSTYTPTKVIAPTATPTPTRVPSTATATPVSPANTPRPTSTQIPANKKIILSGNLLPVRIYEFDQDVWDKNGFSEIPGGFTPNTPKGLISAKKFSITEMPSSSDGLGLALSVDPKQVVFLYAQEPIRTQSKPVFFRLTVRADAASAAVALVALRGDVSTGENLDGSVGTHIPASASHFIKEERRLTLLYEPDAGDLVTPAIQVAATGAVGKITVWIDKLEIFIVDSISFGAKPESLRTPTPIPTSLPTPTPTKAIASDVTPTPTLYSTTSNNPVEIPVKTGGQVICTDGADIIFLPHFATENALVSLHSSTGGLTTWNENYHIASQAFELQIDCTGQFLSDPVLSIPMKVDQLPHPATQYNPGTASVLVLNESTNIWEPINSKVFYDSESKSAVFSVPITTDTQTSSVILSAKASYSIQPQAGKPPYKRKYLIYVPFFGDMVATLNTDSNFRIWYYPKTVKQDAIWSSVGSQQYYNDRIPDYIEDLDKALNLYLNKLLDLKNSEGNAVFDDPTTDWLGLKYILDVYVMDLGSKGDASEGEAAPQGIFTGSIKFHQTKLENWMDMKATVSHEMVHYLQGDYYWIGGKPSYVLGNTWFIDATANYYAAQAIGMTEEEKRGYWGETRADYLSVPIYTNNQSSMYTLAHFLDWLENYYFLTIPIVGDTLSYHKVVHFDDLTNLSRTIKIKSQQSKTIEDAFRDYIRYMMTHPDACAGLAGQVKSSMKAHSMSFISTKASFFSDNIAKGDIQTYVKLEKTMEPLSALYFTLEAKNSNEGLLVIDSSASSGSNLAQVESKTYIPIGAQDSFYTQNAPLETVDKIAGYSKCIVRDAFAAGKPSNGLEKMLINQSQTASSELLIHYYLLLKPEIKAVQKGNLLWSTAELGNIPPELIVGYDVYKSTGGKLNNTFIPYAPFEQSYSNDGINENEDYVVVVVDKKGNVYPEPPEKPTIQTTEFLDFYIDFWTRDYGKLAGEEGKEIWGSHHTYGTNGITTGLDTPLPIQWSGDSFTGTFASKVFGDPVQYTLDGTLNRSIEGGMSLRLYRKPYEQTRRDDWWESNIELKSTYSLEINTVPYSGLSYFNDGNAFFEFDIIEDSYDIPEDDIKYGILLDSQLSVTYFPDTSDEAQRTYVKKTKDYDSTMINITGVRVELEFRQK